MKKIIYTFRTNPFREELNKNFKNLIVFGKLKEDLKKLRENLIREKPNFIIGCAKANRSCIESIAINKFNNKNVSKDGKEFYKLFVPKTNLFSISKKGTSSFCNWTMYKISEIILEDNLDTKVIFIHFKEEDFERLMKFLK
ncbi:MAG: hypothetical protein PVJ67_05550 [Candidatus Pacearchaeota archaeon]|jgi:hypothetical protein